MCGNHPSWRWEHHVSGAPQVPRYARQVWRLAALQPLVSPAPSLPSRERGCRALDSRLTSSLSDALSSDPARALYFHFSCLLSPLPPGLESLFLSPGLATPLSIPVSIPLCSPCLSIPALFFFSTTRHHLNLYIFDLFIVPLPFIAYKLPWQIFFLFFLHVESWRLESSRHKVGVQ